MQKKIWLFSILFIAIDQVIKLIVSNTIKFNTMIEVIPNFFYLTNVHNDGAAFSIFSGNLIFLIMMTLFSLGIVYFLFLKDKKIKGIETILVCMLLGGIIGNFIDRIVYGYVIDYLGFVIFNYEWPIFNFADSCIVGSVLILLILSLKEDLWKNSKLKKKVEE